MVRQTEIKNKASVLNNFVETEHVSEEKLIEIRNILKELNDTVSNLQTVLSFGPDNKN